MSLGATEQLDRSVLRPSPVTAGSFQTRDGVDLQVRPIEAGDRDALQEAFSKLSAESRYRRFLGPVLELRDAELRRLTEVDHHDHEALVAVDPNNGLVGVARYVRLEDSPAKAEVAVTVADEWQARGVGTALLARLTAHAQDEGIELFTASCLADNEDMLILFRELGQSVRQTGAGAGVVELEIELPTDAQHLLAPALRAAATAPTLTAAKRAV